MKLLARRWIDVVRPPDGAETRQPLLEGVPLCSGEHRQGASEHDAERTEVNEENDRKGPDDLEEVIVLLVTRAGDGADQGTRRPVEGEYMPVRPEAVGVDTDDDDHQKEDHRSGDVQSVESLCSVGTGLDEGRLDGHGDCQPDGQVQGEVRHEGVEPAETGRRGHGQVTQVDAPGEVVEPLSAAEQVQRDDVQQSGHEGVEGRR